MKSPKPKQPQKPKKPDKFAARVGVQLVPVDRATVALIARVEDKIPDDIPGEMIALLCLRTMKRHLEMKLAKLDAFLGSDAEHTITHVPKDEAAH